MKRISRAELSEEILELVDAANEVSQKAYAPHSGFCVGAALRLEDGSVLTAANYESDSYGLTQCAERAAIHFSQVSGCADKVVTLAVWGNAKNEELSSRVITPCGACRQWIVELAQRNQKSIDIYCSNAVKTEFIHFSSDDLLPGAFRF